MSGGKGGGGMKRQNTEDFRAVKPFYMILQWWIFVIINLLKPSEFTTPRMSPNVNCGLWVTMMGQCRFMDCNKCILFGGGERCW